MSTSENYYRDLYSQKCYPIIEHRYVVPYTFSNLAKPLVLCGCDYNIYIQKINGCFVNLCWYLHWICRYQITFFVEILFYLLLLLLPCLERTIPEPALYLPMDDIKGNKIQGSINGTVKNGASLVAGKIGNAIFTDGISQYIDYGMHQNECFYNQDVCAKGVTFALWFKAHSDVITFTAIDTGATDRDSRGVYLRYFKTRDLKI